MIPSRFRTTPATADGAATVVAADVVATLFEGIADLGVLPDIDAVLSGYIGTAETGAVLLDIVAKVRDANPRAIFCCDPVIGDIDTGPYVREGVAEFFRDAALTVADIVTPNRFELEFLTGRTVASLGDAAEAAAALRGRGPGDRAGHQPRRSTRAVDDAGDRPGWRLGGRDAAASGDAQRLRRCHRRAVSRQSAQRRERAPTRYPTPRARCSR